ncbi:LCP family protein [Streptomyces sp. NPDC047072]|uniref:LCP family protein n=1 Tax=Streptomyces sp. NPDC047072 TaxID=3154809 RepID=UPI0033CD72F4
MTVQQPSPAPRRAVAVAALVLLATTPFVAVDAASALAAPVGRVAAFESEGGAARPRAGAGTTILLMGTDGRKTITRAEKRRFHAGGAACNCADTLMLVHVSARRDRVSVVSLPRDSLARIPRHRDRVGDWVPEHRAKINAAYAEGGAKLSVRTVEALTGVRVDRYLQVDFRRFMDSVDAVGGVDVCTARPLRDAATKLRLAPGRHHLGGGQALQYVRSRKTDRSADLGRIQRQHRFLVAVLNKVRAEQGLRDVPELVRVGRTLLGSVKVDQGFSAEELASLARVLTELPPSATEFTTVPVNGFNANIRGVGSTLRWDRGAAAKVFAKLRDDRPLTPRNSRNRPTDPPRFAATVAVRGWTLGCG